MKGIFISSRWGHKLSVTLSCYGKNDHWTFPHLSGHSEFFYAWQFHLFVSVWLLSLALFQAKYAPNFASYLGHSIALCRLRGRYFTLTRTCQKHDTMLMWLRVWWMCKKVNAKWLMSTLYDDQLIARPQIKSFTASFEFLSHGSITLCNCMW